MLRLAKVFRVVGVLLVAGTLIALVAAAGIYWHLAPQLPSTDALRAGLGLEPEASFDISDDGTTLVYERRRSTAISDIYVDLVVVDLVSGDQRVIAAYARGRSTWDDDQNDGGGHGTHTSGSIVGNGIDTLGCRGGVVVEHGGAG